MTHPRRIIAAVLIALAAGAWASGRLDRPLSSVGLNRNACVRNAMGATFCGKDADRYCAQFGGVGCASASLPRKPAGPKCPYRSPDVNDDGFTPSAEVYVYEHTPGCR